MCVIAACPVGVTPDAGDLAIACENNPDGFGWAIATRKRVIVHRTMSATEAIDTFLDVRPRYAQSPAMFHARIATHGAKELFGCHPFAVGGDERVMLAHNGILPCEPGPRDPRSDTRVLCEDVIPRNGGIADVVNAPDLWGQWIGTANKLVILAAVPGLPRLVIINEKQGHWDSRDGVWWSNDSYQWPWHAYSATASAHTPREGSWGVDTAGDIWAKCELCTTWAKVADVDGMELCADCQILFGLSPKEDEPRQYCDGCGAYVPERELTQWRAEVICADCDLARWEGADPRPASAASGGGWSR